MSVNVTNRADSARKLLAAICQRNYASPSECVTAVNSIIDAAKSEAKEDALALVERLEAEVNARLDRLFGSINAIVGRLDSLETQAKSSKARLDTQRGWLRAVNKTLDEIRGHAPQGSGSVAEISSDIGEIKARLHSLETSRESTRDSIGFHANLLMDIRKQLAALEAKQAKPEPQPIEPEPAKKFDALYRDCPNWAKGWAIPKPAPAITGRAAWDALYDQPDPPFEPFVGFRYPAGWSPQDRRNWERHRHKPGWLRLDQRFTERFDEI